MKNKETLEEAAEKQCEVEGWGIYEGLSEQSAIKNSFIAGAKWQEERMYSEEDMVNFALFLEIHLPMKPRKTHRQLLEQYKKK